MTTTLGKKAQGAKLDILETWLLEHQKATLNDSLRSARQRKEAAEAELAGIVHGVIRDNLALFGRINVAWREFTHTPWEGELETWEEAGEALCRSLQSIGSIFGGGQKIIADAMRDNISLDRHLVDEHAQVAASINTLAERATAAWPWKDGPWPPLDKEMVRRSDEAYARGEYRDVSDVLADLTGGGDEG